MKATLFEATKASPAVGPAGLTLMGVPLPEWIMVGSAIYTLFLIIDKVPTVIHRCRQFVRWVKGFRNGSQ
jgi:hypothetical protein